MLVETVNVDGAGSVRHVGELDLSTIADVRSALGTAMPRTGRLTLDLSHLTFMGAEGIRLFVDLARERDRIGCVVVASCSQWFGGSSTLRSWIGCPTSRSPSAGPGASLWTGVPRNRAREGGR